MIKPIFKLSTGIILILLFSACEKVIDIDLNSKEAKIVIESNISDLPGPYTVWLSQTVNFDESNVFPPVSAAVVRISDNTGNTEILTETTPGTYNTSAIHGTPDRIYSLEVTSNGKTYKAVSIMPNPVNIDSLTIEYSSDVGPHKISSIVNVHYTDPKGRGNYYRFILLINGQVHYNAYVDDDELLDGEIKNRRLIEGPDKVKLNPGDSVTVLLQTIDKGVYEYFRTLGRINESGGGPMEQSTSPSNPSSNLSDGALGYFNAYGFASKTIII
ncbi:MAG: DUF4249 domain-containing protein [Bacteroidales bacterium]|nr:DUF4249 domain-containing protein [Bacteroidales bacterium]MCF8455896.1 DUF4249 domain-containing protein [Bacteroidales bacterium]